MKIEPFQAHHLALIDVHPVQRAAIGDVDLAKAGEKIEAGGISFTGFVDGSPKFAAGLIEMDTHRAMVWTSFAKDFGRYVISGRNCMMRFLELQDFQRIEAICYVNDPNGARWLALLKFHREGVMKHYWPDGSDAIGFARYGGVNNGH